MKKFFTIIIATLALVSCKPEAPKDYVTLSGKITNKQGDTIKIYSSKQKEIKSITIASDGTFKDTLKVEKGNYILLLDKEYARLYLRNGDEINLTLDTSKFDETIEFTGKGHKESAYMLKKSLLQEETFNAVDELYTLPKEEFVTALEKQKSKFTALLNDTSDFEATFIEEDVKDTDGFFNYLTGSYDAKAAMNKMIGKVSPVFKAYENYNGGTTSLSDLKGKYVYIDVWATWCNPCLAEIPALKELEKELGDKMHFVSISIDKKDKHDAWKKMVTEKELKGVQLYADNDWKSQFVRDYNINGIPRFILIDPKGNVVKPDAPRPSNPKTKDLLKELLK